MDTLDLIRAEPVWGHGPGTYRYAFPEYRNRFRGHRIVTGHPHNEYLELAADFGLVGFGLFALAWLSGAGWVLVRSLQAQETRHALMGFAFLGALAGTMVHSFFDFQMHVLPNALTFAFLAALAVGPLRRRGAVSRGRTMYAWAVALVFVAGLGLAGRTMGSAYLRARADRAVATTSYWQADDAVRGYAQALRMDPTNWRAWKGLGLLRHRQRWFSLDPAEKQAFGQLEVEAMAQGHQYNPKDAELTVGFARALLFAGEIDRGLEVMRQATALRPFNERYWQERGIAERKAGAYAEALETFRHARSIRNTATIRANIAWLEKRLREGPPVDAANAPGDSLDAAPEDADWMPPFLEMEAEPDPELQELFELMQAAEEPEASKPSLLQRLFGG